MLKDSENYYSKIDVSKTEFKKICDLINPIEKYIQTYEEWLDNPPIQHRINFKQQIICGPASFLKKASGSKEVLFRKKRFRHATLYALNNPDRLGYRFYLFFDQKP